MLTARPISRSLRVMASAKPLCRALSTKKPDAVAPKADDEEEGAVSVVVQKLDEMHKTSKNMVWGKTGEAYPAPILPEDPSELAALDPADERHRYKMDGTMRTVVIRQQKSSVKQSPLNPERIWQIFFFEDGIRAEEWTNSLMGWTSSADPYQCAPPLMFENAEDAVYFAKKRGWNYIVAHPVLRYLRDDDRQYQDNFLPQAVAAKIKKEETACDQWYRTAAGTSHYFRPLKYHGDGTVPQYGPNGDAPIAPHVPSYYKLR
jgi:ETC complex I subunit conserved region